MPYRAEAELARDLAAQALDRARAMQGRVGVRDKGCRLGPVTDADLAAERILLEGLGRVHPGDAVLSEETHPRLRRSGSRLWCIDPIDGTREYVDGLAEFAVQIGLLVEGQPVAGALGLGSGEVFWGWSGGSCMVRDDRGDRAVTVPPPPPLPEAVAIHSRTRLGRRTADGLSRLGVARRLPAGGVGFKAMQILLGRAHVYLHYGSGTTWWDTVAPVAVFRAAGGAATDAAGDPDLYREDLRHRAGLLFAAPPLGARALPLLK